MKKTRVLKTKLAEPLKEQLKEERTKSALADKIGVSTQKLNDMINDRWDYITRDALERTADYLGLDVSEVFEFVPVDFWNPIEDAKEWILIEGSQSPLTDRKGFKKTRYNDEASQTVKKFMRDVLNVDEPHEVDHRQSEEELLRQARTYNCILVGSQKTNLATEILISRFFGAEPKEPKSENRKLIPFGFCWADDSEIVRGSSLTCSETARKEMGDRPGIVTSEGVHIFADYQPDEDFQGWKTDDGLDCGLIFVANRPFGTENDVKLILVAGFTGVGTEAAAKALVLDFRELEPVGKEKYLYGVVQARFRKRAQDDVKKLRDFRWAYRSGGHSPIKSS